MVEVLIIQALILGLLAGIIWGEEIAPVEVTVVFDAPQEVWDAYWTKEAEESEAFWDNTVRDMWSLYIARSMSELK